MSRHRVLSVPTGPIALLGLLAAASAAATTGKAPPATGFEAESRLDRRLTLTWPRITVTDAVAHLRRETGVPLSTSRDVADEPLIAAVRDLPARTLLVQIARLMEMDWVVTPGSGDRPTYQLTRTAARRRELEQALRDDRAETLGGVFGVLNLAARYRVLSPAERQARLQAAVRRLEQMRDGRTPNPARHRGGAALVRELQALQLHLQPQALLAIRLLDSLPAAASADLKSGYLVSLSSPTAPGDLALPQAIREGLAALSPPAPFPPSDNPEAKRIREELATAQREQWRRAEGFRAALWFGMVGHTERYGTLAVRFEPIIPGERMRPVGVNVSEIAFSRRLERDQETKAERAARLGSDPLLGRRHAWKAPDYASLVGPTARQAATLARLAQTYGVSVLAQAYRQPSRADLQEDGQMYLFEALDRLAGEDREWARDGEVIRFSGIAALYDRAGFVPDRFFTAWRSRKAAQGELTLDDLAAAAASLDDAQVGGCSDPDPQAQPRLHLELQALRREPQALRFWHLLTAMQRRALQEGAAVPARALIPAQAHFLPQLNRRVEVADGAVDVPQGARPRRSPAQLQDAEIRLQSPHITITNEDGRNETKVRVRPQLIVHLGGGIEDAYTLLE